MKVKHILIIVLVVSMVSLMVSIAVLLNNLSETNLPKGITQVEVINGERAKVTIDSKDYYFSLFHFVDFSEVIELKVETNGGYEIRNLYFTKASSFYDLKVTLKERLSNSIIVWIEK